MLNATEVAGAADTVDTAIASAADIEAQIGELQKWFRDNPKLPNEVDRLFLKRFHQCMYYDMDETKKVIEINYALRNKHPHIFLERDPSDEQSQTTFGCSDMISLPGLTPEKYKVSCYRLIDYDYKKVNLDLQKRANGYHPFLYNLTVDFCKFMKNRKKIPFFNIFFNMFVKNSNVNHTCPYNIHHAADTKAFFMFTDCRFCMPDIEGAETLSEGEVQIFDLFGYSMKHLTKLKINILRIYMKFLQLAFPVRLKAIHLINCPTHLNRMVTVVKPFIHKDVFKMIHFHTESIESLYEFVPRHMLPEEYGGTAGKMADFKAEVMRNLELKRDYLMDANYWRINNFQET